MSQNQTNRVVFRIYTAWTFLHGLATCPSDHTPMCQLVSILHPASQICEKIQFLGFLSILKSINTN
ncbi:hypothetical protein F383_20901 [Gossypium arboreum]|uniref:Uncharacterized protein n=1 Tax=Gossypium arboreum TaxID=29729 RepID=A0A0B0P4R2_GOSAR|nr:hypothetical protein F383_20901 [Gossypium arboreum]